MAGYMGGYRSYRGKTPKWKILLAVVLVLIIIASLAFIRLQSYITYDESGTPHLWMPEKPAAGGTEQRPTASLVVEAPEPEAEPAPSSYTLLLPVSPVTTAEEAAALLSTARTADGVVCPLKGEDGRIYFRTASAVSGAVKATDETAQALSAVVSGTEHSAARLVCFLDSRAAGSDVEGKGLKNTGGYIFYDGNNRQWLDPAKADARAYLCTLAREAAELGFDELILADVGYPTVGKLNKIAYGDTPVEENLELFLQELTQALKDYDVTLTIEMSAEGILSGGEGGLSLDLAAKYAQRIAAAAEETELEALASAVAQAEGEASFVPILTQRPEGYEGSCILREGE